MFSRFAYCCDVSQCISLTHPSSCSGIISPANYELCADETTNCISGGGNFGSTETQVLGRISSGCLTDGDCDDGNACNGEETCDTLVGTCLPGTPISCDDGNVCNGLETCDPVTGACLAGTPLICDDGNACNGLETCDTSAGCLAGAPVVCDDGNACNGIETCDPATGTCLAGEPLVCDDNDACNGLETCDPATGTCLAGTAVDCSNRFSSCGSAKVCDSVSGVCVDDPATNGQDGVCDVLETCETCPGDCTIPPPPVVCGNGICEQGEDCNNCASDCAGITGGNPNQRFCCSGGTPSGCQDSRCNSGGKVCSSTSLQQSSCCGNGICEGGENPWNCSQDCDIVSTLPPTSSPTSSAGCSSSDCSTFSTESQCGTCNLCQWKNKKGGTCETL